MIAIRELSFGYGSERVLERVSFTAPAGVTALLGPNGAGKTTLLRIILGILQPHEGTVSLAGQPLHRYSRRQLSQMIGFVPQNEQITFDLSVKEYVLLGRAPYVPWLELPSPADLQIVSEILEMLSLRDFGDRPISSLSGGERQLVIIARALAQRPQILLLDEPTAHLDLANQARILRVISSLAAQGLSVLFTTHDPNLALFVSDYTVLLRRGAGCIAGPSSALLTAEQLSSVYGVPIQTASGLFAMRPEAARYV
ncbi:MAG: ABC transporter ATP-binding protein [Candidatus Bipolaricaulia bacterium]